MRAGSRCATADKIIASALTQSSTSAGTPVASVSSSSSKMPVSPAVLSTRSFRYRSARYAIHLDNVSRDFAHHRVGGP